MNAFALGDDVAGDDGPRGDRTAPLTADQLDLDWADFVPQVFVPGVATTSAARRSAVLRGTAKKLAADDLPDARLPAIVQQLLFTVPRYHDLTSRHAVHALLEALFAQTIKSGVTPIDAPFIKGTVKLLERELKGNALYGSPPATLFNFSSWTALLIRLCLSSSSSSSSSKAPTTAADYSAYTASPIWKTLIALHATLLDAVGASRGCRNRQLFHRAEALTKRALVAGGAQGVDVVLDTLLTPTVVDGSDGYKTSVFIGVCVSALNGPDGEAIVQKHKDNILSFYLKGVMPSRNAVPAAHLSALAPFFRKCVDVDVFQKTILASSERLLLRSPEVVIKVLDYTLRCVGFDISAIFREKFADVLLNSSFRSTNAVVRHDAASLFATLCSKSSDEKELVKIADLLLKSAVAKAPSVEHRQSYYTAIGQLSGLPEVSRKIVEGGPALVVKESHEAALQLLLQSIATHLRTYLISPSPDAKVVTASVAFVKNGLNDSKAVTRRAFLALTLIAFKPDTLATIGSSAKDIDDAVRKSIDRVSASGVALLDPKKETPLLAEAYMAIRWIQEVDLAKGIDTTSTAFFGKLLTSKSFVLNEKLYSKLLQTADEEISFVRTVLAIIEHDEWYTLVGASDSAADKKPLAAALVWGLVESKHHQVRREVFSGLSRLQDAKRPKLLARLVRLVRIGLGAFIADNGHNARDSTRWIEQLSRSSDTIGHKVYGALCAVLPAVGEDRPKDASAEWMSAIEMALMDLAVVACHPVVTEIMGNDVWIRLCFRSGTGPHIVGDHIAAYVQKWLVKGQGEDVSEGGTSSSVAESFRRATLATIALFTDVATEVLIAEALPWCLKTMDKEEMHTLKAVDVEIWATPAGTLYMDPTAKKANGKVDDRPKTAEEKWERELKKELQKKGKAAPGGKGAAEVKLSKAEREAQQVQLAKEADIRAKVDVLRQQLLVGLNVLQAVVDGVRRSVGDEAHEAFGEWVGRVVRVLLHGVIARELVVVRKGVSGPSGAVLAGQQAVELYCQLGEISGSQLSALVHPPALAMATLRAIGVAEGSEEGVAKRFCKQSLPVYLSSVLNQVKEQYTSQQPLEPAAFSYVFPLLRAIVLREGRIGALKERDATDLAMAASDVLLAHCGLASSSVVPRCGMVRALIEMLECYPRVRGAGREGLLTVAFAISAEADDDDEDEEDGERDAREGDADSGESVSDVVKELLDGLLSPEESVRESCLMALSHLTIPSEMSETFDTRVWVARFDEHAAIQEQAQALWTEWNGEDARNIDRIDDVISLVVHDVAAVRGSAGRAMCGILTHHSEIVGAKLEDLYALYVKKVEIPEPEYDGYGMVVPESLNRPDEWEARAGIASALNACVPILKDLDSLRRFFAFLIEGEALGDRNETVRREMLSSGLSAANASGKTYVRELLDVINAYLSKPANASETHDRIREACVILLGTFAQHLEATDPLIPEVIAKLMDTLKTPSETVQMAVSECLPALVKVNKQDSRRLVEKLLHQLYTSPKYGERRGAAYGLAGVVKGCGISALKEYSIMSSLREAVEDKKRVEKREGAVFAFETLSQTLGRLFEPYVIQILPLLLVCFGDNSREVREATEDACRVIMSKLSAHCVKLVLPSLLNGLEDRNWRTKTGAIDVLASMAFLAPKQLSVSLPTVVPRICEVLADSHAKVQESAKHALNQFGNVIKNPEIQALVPVLLAALVDPNGKTGAALTSLLDTAFVHYIDAPSLALLVPILQRGLRERSTDIKKRAAQIMGNMASLTDPKDLVPYLDSLMPELKEVLVDPVPEARATSARAFGNMVAKLGEENFPGLVSELCVTLKSDVSGVDRIGAAQGLSEVLAGLGIERLEGLLPEMLANANSPKVYVREGFMTLMIYLPGTFGDKFQPYLGSIIAPVLRGLADESEPVRDSSLKTGKMIIRNYASSAVDLLLPQLETGLFDENWRIRQSSTQLMGDLLYRIAGVSGKVETDGAEDEGLGTEHGRQALISTLGKERFDRVLASLYVARSDANNVVRQACLHVWKSIVSNTPRTLKEILPIMMDIIVASLASESADKRGCAARCLADLVRKLGESILTELLPILEKGLDSDRKEIRQGVCVAMSEIMASAGKTQVIEFVEECVALIRKALVDEAPDVREAAAQAFDMLHQHMGRQAIDEILPSLLNMLKSGDKQADRSSVYALEALKEIMAVRSNVVFPVLIPTLIARPISAFNARALASLITVAGQALNRRLDAIFPALMDAVEEGGPAVEDVKDTIKVLLVNVQGDEGVRQIMSMLTDAVENGGSEKQIVGCQCLQVFCESNQEELETDDVGDWLEVLVSMLRVREGGSSAVVKSAWNALDALIKRVPKDEMEDLVLTLRRALRDVEEGLDDSETIEGLCLPKGLSPILPIFLQGLLYGTADCREQSALGLGDLVRRTTPETLKPYVTQITGPLIRVIGDRFPSGVKSAILMSLGHLLDRVAPMLKPFLPQLQRTFVKCLSESSGMVRDRAARCLASLIPLQTRLDPLIVELTQGLRGADDSGVRAAMWEALYGVVKGVGGPGRDISDTSRKTIEALITEKTGEHDDGARTGAAKVFGAYCAYVPAEDARSIITTHILGAKDSDEWFRIAGALMTLDRVVRDAPALVSELGVSEDMAELVASGLRHGKPQVVEAAVAVAGALLARDEYLDIADHLIPPLVDVLTPGGTAPNEARKAAELVVKGVAKRSHKTLAPHLSKVVSSLMLNVRDRNPGVKHEAERTLRAVLQIGQGTPVLQEHLGTLDAATARNLGDYARKVLSKLSVDDSGDDEAGKGGDVLY
ncbi:armadillo-type protein [Geranomyces variabilis]|nr:armadillo-type protein [Geranomyces variabilis]KAJ3143693.1 translational activator of GCN4 [Geranomyces variabilis]